jgi:hypothetical protein
MRQKPKKQVPDAPRNKSWGGISFPGKWGMPSILLTASLLAAFRVDSRTSLLGFILLFFPMSLAALFLLVVPWQLRVEVENGRLWFRKWFHWRCYRLDQLKDVHRIISVFGSLKLTGSDERLVYFIEPDNDFLLDSKKAVAEGCRASGSVYTRQALSFEFLSGTIGFILGILWAAASMTMGSNSANVSPAWLTTMAGLENRFRYFFAAAVIATLAFKLTRTNRQHGTQRVVYSGILGLMIAELLIPK